MSKFLTKDELLKIDDIVIEEIHVPEWRADVRIKGLTAEERDEIEGAVILSDGKRDVRNLRARMVAQTVVDEAGNRMFTFEEAQALGKKSSRAIGRLFQVACRLAGMTPEDMEEMEGESAADQGSGSSTA